MGTKMVVAAARHVGPAGWLYVVHRYLETIRPEQVERHISHQLELGLVGAGLYLLKDVGPGWRLGIEVPPDDGIKLLETARVRNRDPETIGRKDDLVVLIEFSAALPITFSMRRW